MGLLDSFSNSLNEKVNDIQKKYERQLRTASDSTVLSKLRDAENSSNSQIYDITYKEARRRGLV